MTVCRLLACLIGVSGAAAVFAAALAFVATSPEAAFHLWAVGGLIFVAALGLALVEHAVRGGQ